MIYYYLLKFTLEINIFSLIAFLSGIFAGFVILGLIYFIGCLRSITKKKNKINKIINEISQEEIKEIIFKYQDAFKDEKKRRKEIPFDYFKSSIYSLMNEIAGKFYPKSKRPLLELSFDELLLLDNYIAKKIDDLLSRKGLILFRKLKLSTIMNLVDKKTAIDNNKAVNSIKKYKLKKVYDVFLFSLNLINPYLWFKKIIVNPAINILLNKVFIVCYSIVGEETYNIYSKQIFNNDDNEIKQLLNDIDKDSLDIEDNGILIEKKK